MAQLRTELEETRVTITPEVGELIYITDTKKLWVGDGVAIGGIQIGDVTSELTDYLDLNTYDITGLGDIIIAGDVTAGDVTAENITVNIINTEEIIGGVKIDISDAAGNAYKVSGITDGTSTGFYLNFNASRGTIDNPENTQSGDLLSGWLARGWHNGDFKYASGMSTKWADDADFTKNFPSSNLLFVVNNNTDTQEVIPAYLTSNGTFVAQAIQTGVYTDTPDTKPAGTKGLIIFNDTTGTFQGYNGTDWVNLNS